MIRVYTDFRGLAFPLFFMAGLVLVLSIFFWGFTKAIGLLLPLLIVISYLLIIVFVFGVLPCTFIKGLRPALAAYSLGMSHALGAFTWMVSFFFVVKTFGFAGIILSFLFQLLAPVALIGAVIKGAWPIAGHLVIWLCFAYGMKFYSQRLSNLSPRDQKKGNIIDVDAVEV